MSFPESITELDDAIVVAERSMEAARYMLSLAAAEIERLRKRVAELEGES